MKKVISILLAGIICFGLCACKPKTVTTELKPVTVVLDWTPNTNHTGMFAAQELGYYREAGLDVKIIQPAEDSAVLMVGARRADFCVTFQEELAAARTSDKPVPVTAVCALIQHNTSGVVSLKDQGIKSFKDLEGKRYGSWGIPVYDEILFEAVRAQKGDPSKIKMINNTATDTYAALKTDFDAVWIYYGWDGVIGETKGIETNFLSFRDANPVLDYYTPVLAANDDYLKENPETAKAFLAATAKGYEYAIAHPDEAAGILVKASPEISIDIAKAGQAYLAGEYQADAAQWGIIDQARWARFNDWLFEKKIIPEKLGTAGFTNDYLPEKS